MTNSALNKYLTRYPYVRERKGGGLDCQVLLAYDRLRTDLKESIRSKYYGGLDPYEATKRNQFSSHIKPDVKAKEFFDNFMKPNGEYLSSDRRTNYYNNAIILNAIHEVRNNRKATRKSHGGRATNMWAELSHMVNELDTNIYKHTLPGNFRRLQDRYNEYVKEGYESLIHEGIGNANTRKVDEKFEKLILSLYCMDNRPFSKWIIDYYLQFLSGAIDVVDEETGEVFDRIEFYDKSGDPILISESTAWAYLNKPNNQRYIRKFRKCDIDYRTQEMGFNHRRRPTYSLSKISFDDRTLPRKAMDGTWVQCYYAYDVMSECFIGAAYSKEKDINLVYDCFRDMFNNIERYNLIWPAEAEVERHLMWSIKDKLEAMFAFVHFCLPENSREKRAEHAIRSKKYGTEKKEQNNIGRWSNKLDAYNINTDKIEKLSQAQLIADDKHSIASHNHAPHSKIKGKTRWQVLMENQNPDYPKPQKRILYKYIGIPTITSIRNNDYVRVQYADYAIETTNILARLKPNNKDVTAFWMPTENGDIPEVYLYQDDKFLCRATKYDNYNEALAERTERDEEIRIEQAKRQAHHRKEVKEGIQAKVAKVVIIENNMDYKKIEPVLVTAPLEITENKSDWEFDDDDYVNKALDF